MIPPFTLPILTALADETRLEILEVLSTSENAQPVALIHARLGRKRQIISHHLRVLLDAKLVTMTKSGPHNLYAINWHRNSHLSNDFIEAPGSLGLLLPLTEPQK